MIGVETSAGLREALDELPNGGIVQIAPGNYTLKLFEKGPEAGVVRFVALDPKNPPVFSWVSLNACKNISLEGLVFRDTTEKYALNVLKCEGIAVKDCAFSGDATGFRKTREDPFGGRGIMIRSSERCGIEGSSIERYGLGATFWDVVDGYFLSNVVSKTTGDGLRLSGVQRMQVLDNRFLAVFGAVQKITHTDMLQLWARENNDLQTKNLLIATNTFDSRGGPATQTMFMKNETFGSTGLYHEDVVIANNTIWNGHVNGIALYDSLRARILFNKLLFDSEAFMLPTSESKPQQHPPAVRLNGEHVDSWEVGNKAA